jgi:hypothetical protein
MVYRVLDSGIGCQTINRFTVFKIDNNTYSLNTGALKPIATARRGNTGYIYRSCILGKNKNAKRHIMLNDIHNHFGFSKFLLSFIMRITNGIDTTINKLIAKIPNGTPNHCWSTGGECNNCISLEENADVFGPNVT